MIDFELGDELELVRKTARDFASDHLRPSLREHELARTPSVQARAAFSEIGFATLEWPESILSLIHISEPTRRYAIS